MAMVVCALMISHRPFSQRSEHTGVDGRPHKLAGCVGQWQMSCDSQAAYMSGMTFTQDCSLCAGTACKRDSPGTPD